MPGVVGLYYHLAGIPVTSGATAYLRHLLEGTLVAAEVGVVDEVVGIDDPHHAHILKVKAFGHHLRADKYLYTSVREVVEEFYVLVLLQCAVKVHTCHPSFGEHDLQVFLYALGADAGHAQMGGVARGTLRGHRDAVATVVAA